MNTRTRKSHISMAEEDSQGKYAYISLELRSTLIDMVIKQGISVYRASKDLKINNSTAKVIIRNFRNRGHVYCRKTEQNRIKCIAQQQFLGQNQQIQNNITPAQIENDVAISQLQWPQLNNTSFTNSYCFYLCYPMYYMSDTPFGFTVTE